ncbi:integrase arm-type DNA-binding domain-containing protein [Paraburkholderia sp. BR14320]|uniref:integrase arm-type DNA-binding domain-containing protein n=1 Tax=unclassified Paraburkholderia TaxID=2615204 RepID=UPI0034CF76FF
MTFDPHTAKLLKPGEYQSIDNCPGLRLWASASKHAWIYRYNDAEGRKRQIKIGEWPAMPLADAMREWDQLRQARKDGKDPATEKRAARAQSPARPADRKRDALPTAPSPTPGEIRAARLAANLTQTAAGELLHTTCRTWQQWEAGDRAMHPAFWELFQRKVGEVQMQ